MRYWRFTLGWLVVLVLIETTGMVFGFQHSFILGLLIIFDTMEFLNDSFNINLFGKEG